MREHCCELLYCSSNLRKDTSMDLHGLEPIIIEELNNVLSRLKSKVKTPGNENVN